MYKIGITGSIASGKTTVRQILQEMGYDTIDADEISHQILQTDDDLWAKLVHEFGDGILDPEGSICRSCLARLVFSDRDKKIFLEQQIHPLIIEYIKEKASAIQERTGAGIIFVEAALLFEAGLDDWFDEIWYVSAEREQQIERLIKERYYSEDEALIRIDAIADLEEEQLQKCHRIDNSQTLQYTRQQIEELLDNAINIT